MRSVYPVFPLSIKHLSILEWVETRSWIKVSIVWLSQIYGEYEAINYDFDLSRNPLAASMRTMIELYAYKGCDTCRKAKRWLDERQVVYREVPIRESPPNRALLCRALADCGGELRKLFNASGRDYRELGMKDRLPQLTEEAALELLSTNGNLVKRPFLATPVGAVAGFREDAWARMLV